MGKLIKVVDWITDILICLSIAFTFSYAELKIEGLPVNFKWFIVFFILARINQRLSIIKNKRSEEERKNKEEIIKEIKRNRNAIHAVNDARLRALDI